MMNFDEVELKEKIAQLRVEWMKAKHEVQKRVIELRVKKLKEEYHEKITGIKVDNMVPEIPLNLKTLEEIFV